MSSTESVTWVVEPIAFPDRYRRFLEAIEAAGHEVLTWTEETTIESAPTPRNSTVVFHGSLGTAAEVHRASSWSPGAYCDVESFHCSRWYPRAEKWLLADTWLATTVAELTCQRTPKLTLAGTAKLIP